jgi:hypothetical protein
MPETGPLPDRIPGAENGPEADRFTDGKGSAFVPGKRSASGPQLNQRTNLSLSARERTVSERLPEATPQEREMIIKRIETLQPTSVPAYFRSIPDGDLKAMLEEIRGELLQRQPQKPPWCGTCKEDTRLIELPDDRATRCPECHPFTVGGGPG